MSVDRFAVSVSEHTLTDLRERLMRTRWADEVADEAWRFGTNRAYLQELTEYWLT
jgi:hypothetical protein